MVVLECHEHVKQGGPAVTDCVDLHVQRPTSTKDAGTAQRTTPGRSTRPAAPAPPPDLDMYRGEQSVRVNTAKSTSAARVLLQYSPPRIKNFVSTKRARLRNTNMRTFQFRKCASLNIASFH